LQKLGIGELPLKIGFQVLKQLGFNVKYGGGVFQISQEDKWDKGDTGTRGRSDTVTSPLRVSASPRLRVSASPHPALEKTVEQFLAAVREEQFRRKYFNEVPLATIKAMAARTVFDRVSRAGKGKFS
jgi:single-stranded-DNA-specific exonuclease